MKKIFLMVEVIHHKISQSTDTLKQSKRRGSKAGYHIVLKDTQSYGLEDTPPSRKEMLQHGVKMITHYL